MTLNHSFVVLAYGRSPFLGGCLRSLRAQTTASRILIATSTPSTFIDRVASEYDCDVLVNPIQAGIASDWNFGLQATSSRFVTLVHQDDTYEPEFLARTLDLFATNCGALCFTSYSEIDDQGQLKASKISYMKHLIERMTIGDRKAIQGARLWAFLAFGNPLPCSSVTFDKQSLEKFKFSYDYESNLDWDAWWRLLNDNAVFLHVPERLVGRRYNEMTATSRLLQDGTRRREDLIMFRRIWPWPLGDIIAYFYRAGY